MMKLFNWWRKPKHKFIKHKFIKWQIYLPWYAIATVLMIYVLREDVGPVWRDWRALFTLPFTTFPLFISLMQDVTMKKWWPWWFKRTMFVCTRTTDHMTKDGTFSELRVPNENDEPQICGKAFRFSDCETMTCNCEMKPQ